MEKAKIKLSVVTGEIEIEGSEEFVKDQLANLKELTSHFRIQHQNQTIIEKYQQNDEEEILDVQKDVDIEVPTEKDVSMIPENFGEWFHRYPRDLGEQEKVLATGYFIQKTKSDNNDFKSQDITKYLKEQGVSIANTSMCLTRLKSKKHIIQVGKSGKRMSYRVSVNGKDYIDEVLD